MTHATKLQDTEEKHGTDVGGLPPVDVGPATAPPLQQQLDRIEAQIGMERYERKLEAIGIAKIQVDVDRLVGERRQQYDMAKANAEHYQQEAEQAKAEVRKLRGKSISPETRDLLWGLAGVTGILVMGSVMFRTVARKLPYAYEVLPALPTKE